MPVEKWNVASDRWLAQVADAVGVTRVAPVTGLDRTGVPVACAIRPRGHVLQVTNGKGLTPEAAAYSAVLEAAELFAAEHPDPSLWRRGTVEEVARGTGEPVVVEDDSTDEFVQAWVQGEALAGGPAWVPAARVFCPPADGPALGVVTSRWTSNGLGAGKTRAAALLHALFEVIERDQLAHVLPYGWTPQFVRQRGLAAEWMLRNAPRAQVLAAQLQSSGFDVFTFDASAWEREGGAAVAAALLFDREGGPVPLASGYAARAEPDAALVSAILEAAQSRLTDIHGAREDVSPMNRDDAATLRRWCAQHPGKHQPTWSKRLPGALTAPLAGPNAVAVSLPTGVPSLHVVKVVAPDLLLSELL